MERADTRGPGGERLGVRRFAGAVGLLLAAAVLVLMRLHAFALPLETDECNYAYIAGRLLAGDRLYVDVWDHQPFGIFALLAGVIAVFGDGMLVFRLLAMVLSLATLAGVYAMARRSAGEVAGVAAAGLFALASADPGTAGEGCNREIYMNACIVAAWWLGLRRDRPRWRETAGAGAALAIGSTIKTIVAVHWLLLAGWLVARAIGAIESAPRWRRAVAVLLAFGLPPLVVWAVALAYFSATGRAAEFVEAVFTVNLSYSGGGGGFFPRFADFFTPRRHPFIFDSAWPLWLVGGAGYIVLLATAVVRRSATHAALVLLGAANYVATCLPAQFWPHYYYLMVPSLAASAGVVIVEVAAWAASKWRVNTAALCGAAALALAAWLGYTQYRHYLSQPPLGITINRYNTRDFWGRAMGHKVASVTAPSDTVFVYGSDAAIYYYADRRCASRFTMLAGIHHGYAGFERRRNLLMADLRRAMPTVILVLFDEPPFEEWTAFLHEHYSEPVGWDFKDGTQEPIMFVVTRKDSPILPIEWSWDRSEVTSE